jgi:hypothetical protein
MGSDQPRNRIGQFASTSRRQVARPVPDQQVERITQGFNQQAQNVLALEESLFEDQDCLRYLRAEVMPDDVEHTLSNANTPFKTKAACALYPNLKTARMAYLDNDIRIKVLALRNPVVDPGETFDDLDDLDADGAFQAHLIALFCEAVG